MPLTLIQTNLICSYVYIYIYILAPQKRTSNMYLRLQNIELRLPNKGAKNFAIYSPMKRGNSMKWLPCFFLIYRFKRTNIETMRIECVNIVENILRDNISIRGGHAKESLGQETLSQSNLHYRYVNIVNILQTTELTMYIETAYTIPLDEQDKIHNTPLIYPQANQAKTTQDKSSIYIIAKWQEN